MRRLITSTTALLAIGAAGVGWGLARRLTAPVSSRTFDLVIRDVERDGDSCLIALDRTHETTAVGSYNLWFENGGWAQLSNTVLDRGPNRIARIVTRTSEGLSPAAGDRVSWSGIYFASPADAGLRAQDVTVDTAHGPAPAWLIGGEPGSDEGRSSTWAIHIHGLGSTRAGTLRGIVAAAEHGYTSLVITYRNDGEGPHVGSGRSTLGFTESDDAAAAVEYAVQHGAARIVLFGWSMGGTIALHLADQLRNRSLVAGLVLDSPVLDWAETIKANSSSGGIPASVGTLALPWLTLRPLAHAVGLPDRVPLQKLDWVTRATELAVPTLILHGTQDDSAPFQVSQVLHARRPDLVQLEAFDAGHTLPWNSDPERWQTTVSTWLSAQVSA